MNELRLTVNGEMRTAPPGTTVTGLLATMGIDPARVAVERNQDVIPRRTWTEAALADGDRIEIVAFVGGGSEALPTRTGDDPLIIAGRKFGSRLLVGTGQVPHPRRGTRGHSAFGRRHRDRRAAPGRPDARQAQRARHHRSARHTLLPNTAGCYTAEEAVRTCRLARELGMADLVKLEVIGDERTLFPDGAATLEAARILVKDGFTVLPYCIDDPIWRRSSKTSGCAAVMPLAAPIGSGLGIRNPYNLRIIIEQAKVPVIVDAGVGTASRRGGGDGARLRRRAHEHRHRGRARSAPDGRGDARRGRVPADGPSAPGAFPESSTPPPRLRSTG